MPGGPAHCVGASCSRCVLCGVWWSGTVDAGRDRMVAMVASPATIVVLGAQVMADGRPSTALRRRAEHGAAVWSDLGGSSRFIACGGMGDAPVSEARVIADIALASGVSPGSIVLEEHSSNTREQAMAVAELLGGGARVVVVSDRYHLPRARFLMRRAGLDATSSGSGRAGGRRTRWWLGALREIPAFAKDALAAWVLPGRSSREPR